MNPEYKVVQHFRMDCDRTKLDILWKRYNAVSSTSSHKQYFEEREAPSSRYPVFQDLQIYTQSNLIPLTAPADLQALSGTSTDSNGSPMAGSFYGTTSSYVSVVRRYLQVPLVATPSPCGMAYQSPKCVAVNNSAGNSPPFAAGETLKGMTSGALAALVSQQGLSLFYKQYCGSLADFVAGEIVQGLTSNTQVTVVFDSTSAPLSRCLRNVIAFDYGVNGSYAYQVYKSDGTPIYFGQGGLHLDTYSGVLTFYGQLPAGVSDATPPSISFYRYVGKIGLNTSHLPNGSVGIGTDNPAVSLDIESTDAIRIPTGTTGQRPPNPQLGYVRFNTDTDSLEVWNGESWQDALNGTGYGSNNVSIATGGVDRQVTIGNAIGSSSVSVAAGSGGISLASGNGVAINANSSVNIQTASSAGSQITIGSGIANETIVIDASGSNSSVVINGPVEFTQPQNLAIGPGQGLYFDNAQSMADWRIIELPNPNNASITSLSVQHLISGTWTNRFRID